MPDTGRGAKCHRGALLVVVVWVVRLPRNLALFTNLWASPFTGENSVAETSMVAILD